MRRELPTLVSHQRFVELLPTVVVPLLADVQQRMGDCTGISFVDSTPLEVCHPARIRHHRVFAKTAKRGKTSVGWFYGFKLHLLVNDRGEPLSFASPLATLMTVSPCPNSSSRPATSLASFSGTRATSRKPSPSS